MANIIFSNPLIIYQAKTKEITFLKEVWILGLRPRPHKSVFKRKRSCFVPDTAIVHTTTPKTITENGAILKRSPGCSDLKTILFENAVF